MEIKSPQRIWALILLAILVVVVGVCWMKGWFPFASHELTEAQKMQQLIDETTATGSPATSTAQMLKDTTAKTSAKISATTTAKLIDDTTSH